MHIYPVTREWDEAGWLAPFLMNTEEAKKNSWCYLKFCRKIHIIVLNLDDFSLIFYNRYQSSKYFFKYTIFVLIIFFPFICFYNVSKIMFVLPCIHYDSLKYLLKWWNNELSWNGLKWLEMAGNGWNWLELARVWAIGPWV